jgi:hypothetical protein
MHAVWLGPSAVVHVPLAWLRAAVSQATVLLWIPTDSRYLVLRAFDPKECLWRGLVGFEWCTAPVGRYQALPAGSYVDWLISTGLGCVVRVRNVETGRFSSARLA